MKPIDIKRPVRLKGANSNIPVTILYVDPNCPDYPLIGHITKDRADLRRWSIQGSSFDRVFLGKRNYQDIENAPEQIRVPLTFDNFKEGVLLKSESGNEVYTPLKCHSRGVTIVWDDTGSVSFLTYEELMELKFSYKPMSRALSSSWKPCYTYQPVE